MIVYGVKMGVLQPEDLVGKLRHRLEMTGEFLVVLLLQERADGSRTAEGLRAEVNGKSVS